MHSWLGRALAGGILVFSAGCHRPAHPEAKQQAEQRWKEVRARVKLQLGRQQYEGGLFEEATDTLAEAVSLDPRQLEAYVLLARANLERAKPATAQQVLDAARKAGLDSADLHYTQGVLFEQRDQIDAATQEYARARAMDPGNADYFIAYVECLVSANRAAEAMPLLDENLHRFDESFSVAALAGHVATLLGDDDRAGVYFARASVVDDESVIAEQHGLLLARAGRCEEAVAVLGPVAQQEDAEGSGAVRRALATCELALGRAVAAKGRMLDYAHAHPDDAAAQIILAQAAIETDDLATADRALAVVEQRAANHAAVSLTRAAWHWRQGEYPAAASHLYDLVERDPENVDAYRLLAEVLLRQNQPDAAKQCLEYVRVGASKNQRPN